MIATITFGDLIAVALVSALAGAFLGAWLTVKASGWLKQKLG